MYCIYVGNFYDVVYYFISNMLISSSTCRQQALNGQKFITSVISITHSDMKGSANV